MAIEIFDREGWCSIRTRTVAGLLGSVLPEGYNIFHDEVAEAASYGDLVRRAFRGETLRLPPLR
jgi:hypothetical protein